MENWQSEFLQFTLFIAATIWLVQKGSNESKKLEDDGLETDEQQRVGRMPRAISAWARSAALGTRVYENSLLLVMGVDLPRHLAAQSVNNWQCSTTSRRA